MLMRKDLFSAAGPGSSLVPGWAKEVPPGSPRRDPGEPIPRRAPPVRRTPARGAKLRSPTVHFIADNGQPYRAVHHVIPLAEGGEDRIENVACLRPAHYREVHQGRPAQRPGGIELAMLLQRAGSPVQDLRSIYH
jgi:hypothetical protein